MESSRRASWAVWSYLTLLMLAVFATFAMTRAAPTDDHYLYQQFIEALAAGRIDLTIAGFHGTDVFGLLVYFFTKSPIAQIQGLIIPAVLLPPVAYLAGNAMLRDRCAGVLLATIVTMMPFISFVCLRGWTGPGYWFWMLLAVWLAAKRSPWAGVPWALAVLSKPFAIILLPLIVVLFVKKKSASLLGKWNPLHWFTKNGKKRDELQLGIALTSGFALIAAYFAVQYAQAGRILIGAHEGLTATGAIQGPLRFVLNLAHSLQILFSVHNYYFPDPSLTGAGNLMHTSPVLIFLALFGLFAAKTYWKDVRYAYALLSGAVAGILMNALLDHMDHFYMEASILLLILASLPVLLKHKLWIPVALATLHFQWLYFYLQFRDGFGLGPWFFLVPTVVDVSFMIAVLMIGKEYWSKGITE